MSSIEEFRIDLWEVSSQDFTDLDLDQIMGAGRRIRRWRRIVTGAAVTGAAVGVLMISMVVANLVPMSDRNGLVGGPGNAASATPQPSAQPGQLGSAVSTGIRQPKGELVFWFRTLDQPLPGITFCVTAGTRTSGGTVVAAIATNETEGVEDSPGFHAVQGQMEVNGLLFPTFGYYAGPAKTIVATINGKAVWAHTATWDLRPGIVLFWFDLANGEPTDFRAYDAGKTGLPQGNTGVGHG